MTLAVPSGGLLCHYAGSGCVIRVYDTTALILSILEVIVYLDIYVIVEFLIIPLFIKDILYISRILTHPPLPTSYQDLTSFKN